MKVNCLINYIFNSVLLGGALQVRCSVVSKLTGKPTCLHGLYYNMLFFFTFLLSPTARPQMMSFFLFSCKQPTFSTWSKSKRSVVGGGSSRIFLGGNSPDGISCGGKLSYCHTDFYCFLGVFLAIEFNVRV